MFKILILGHTFLFFCNIMHILHSCNKKKMSSLIFRSTVAENQRLRLSKREPYRFLPRLEK